MSNSIGNFEIADSKVNPLVAGQVTLFWTSDRRFANILYGAGTQYLQNEARVDWVKTGF